MWTTIRLRSAPFPARPWDVRLFDAEHVELASDSAG